MGYRVVQLQAGEEVTNLAATHEIFGNTTPCANWKGKYWTIAVLCEWEGLKAANETDFELFARLVQLNGWEERPFFVGRCGHVSELMVLARCTKPERCHLKSLKGVAGATVSALTLQKGGQQNDRLCATIRQAFATCGTAYTNMRVCAVREAAEAEAPQTTGMTYDDALLITINWGTQKFVSFAENCRLKRSRKEALEPLEHVALVCRSALLDMIKLREDSDEWVVEFGTERHRRACPLSWDDAVVDEAKRKVVFRWEPAEGDFHRETLQQYLDGSGHLLSSLIVVGEGGTGKSRMLHTMATEITIGADQSCYLFGKSLDALGILSFSGAVRRAGCVVITDADLRVARGAWISTESFKSLVDVEEGGALLDTR